MFSLLAILIRPDLVFPELRKSPNWVPPLAATVALTFIASFALVRMAGLELVTLQRFQQDRHLAERVGEDAINKAVTDSGSRVPKVIYLARDTGIAAAELMGIAVVLQLAAWLMRLRPPVGFFPMLAMVSYAFYPFALLRCVASIAILANTGDPGSLDLENVMGLNLGALLNRPTANPSLFQIAASLDVVDLAQLVFLAFGFAKVAQIPFFRALALCGVLWMVVVLWKAALAVFL